MIPAMSLATRCTACGTIFRVVQDQLRVSEGWVRCGRCAEVFDANEQLFDIDREAPPPWPPLSSSTAAATPQQAGDRRPAMAEPQPVAAPTPSRRPDESTWVMPRDSHTHARATSQRVQQDLRDEPEESPDAGEPTIQLPPMYAADALAPSVMATPSPGTSSAARHHEDALPADDASPQRREPVWDADPVPATEDKRPTPKGLDKSRARLDGGKPAAVAEPAPMAAAKPEPAVAAEPPQPSFMRQAGKRDASAGARWQGLALLVGCLLLLTALGLQALWQFRNALLALHPPAEPMLSRFCEMAGCSLEPWKRIDGLAVETSSLTQAGSGNHYKLGIQLQNKAGYALALPWVDLSLTDASGALVARRMLKPADFNLSKGSIAAHSEEALQLVFSTDKLKISGYSVVIFHP